MQNELDALFPKTVNTQLGAGLSKCDAANARMFEYELFTPNEQRLRGCLRALDKKDARRILLNRHPDATQIVIGKGRRTFVLPKKD